MDQCSPENPGRPAVQFHLLLVFAVLPGLKVSHIERIGNSLPALAPAGW